MRHDGRGSERFDCHRIRRRWDRIPTGSHQAGRGKRDQNSKRNASYCNIKASVWCGHRLDLGGGVALQYKIRSRAPTLALTASAAIDVSTGKKRLPAGSG